jgi:phosphonate metabolism-associated iron-containing alcohol dehydrogenase
MMHAITAHAWHMPVKVIYGIGALERLSDIVAQRPCLLIAHANSVQGNWLRTLQEALSTSLIDTVIAPDGLPTVDIATTLCEQVWQALADVSDPIIVALGGGACLDLAKATAHRPGSGRPEHLMSWLRGETDQPALRPIPLIAIPTTAGTGSEVTRWATLWDVRPAVARKLSLESLHGYPEASLVDARVCLTCPTPVTRDSGLDALAHALEAIWNRNATPLTDALALSAAQSIIQALPHLLEAPHDLALRRAMSHAALQAGFAFSHTRTALAHALSYDLTLQQGLPHGLACAVWLPQVWRMAAGKDTTRDALLAQVFGEAGDGDSLLGRWLSDLGVNCDAYSVASAENKDRIESALHHPRGKNFIGANP